MTDISTIYRGPEHGGNYEQDWGDASYSIQLISDVGRKREHNEDSCLLCVPDDKSLRGSRGILLAVADGMGGASAGEHASHLALTVLADRYFNNEGDSIPVALETAVEEANKRVFDESEADLELQGMGTTMSAVVFHGSSAYIGQVGDSRVYLFRDSDGLVQITDDHSLVWEQLKAGIITEEEAKSHSLRNLITRAIGIKEDVEVDLFSLTLEQGDMLLVCSDGLCGMIDDPEILVAMQADTLHGAGRLLVGKALDAGGTDNVTAGLLQVTETPEKKKIQVGCEERPAPAADGIVNRIKRLFG
ncbi:MAG TPA: Stp1/IreP family PP2C-type Ser/Thr phosphatase [Candidatus Hydrogenedentes bacterium]|nr:Stp1/IreP family PP2C-type Ser/Thr phosphatase [Candidatus Hydrogenedentota bacterium]